MIFPNNFQFKSQILNNVIYKYTNEKLFNF